MEIHPVSDEHVTGEGPGTDIGRAVIDHANDLFKNAGDNEAGDFGPGVGERYLNLSRIRRATKEGHVLLYQRAKEHPTEAAATGATLIALGAVIWVINRQLHRQK